MFSSDNEQYFGENSRYKNICSSNHGLFDCFNRLKVTDKSKFFLDDFFQNQEHNVFYLKEENCMNASIGDFIKILKDDYLTNEENWKGTVNRSSHLSATSFVHSCWLFSAVHSISHWLPYQLLQDHWHDTTVTVTRTKYLFVNSSNGYESSDCRSNFSA